MPKICKNCGKLLPDVSRFCTECGVLAVQQEAPQQSAMPQGGQQQLYGRSSQGTNKGQQSYGQPNQGAPYGQQRGGAYGNAGNTASGEWKEKKYFGRKVYTKNGSAPVRSKLSDKKAWIIAIAAFFAVIAVIDILFVTGVIGKSKEDEEQLNNYTIDYYRENAELLNVIDAKTSVDTVTEADAGSELTGRGFYQYPIEYNFTIDGEFLDDSEVSGGSQDKHPVYYTYYKTESGELWTVYLINGNISAYPSSYNMESDLQAELIVSESKNLMSYDAAENRFYETIPYDSAVIVKVVDRIDAETLNKLTLEEVSK